MVGGPVEFIPGYSLFFTNRGQKELYKQLGIRTLSQFDTYLKKIGNPDVGIPPEDLEKMVFAGLVWDHKALQLEEVEDIVEKYYREGHDYNDFNNVIMDALAESGLLNKNLLKAVRDLKELPQEEIEKKILEAAQQNSKQEEDTGE